MLDNTEKYTHILIDELQNKYYKDNSDSLRLMKVIVTYCEYKKIRNELEVNKDYFMKDIEFDGGLKIKKLLSTKWKAKRKRKKRLKKPSNVITKSLVNN